MSGYSRILDPQTAQKRKEMGVRMIVPKIDFSLRGGTFYRRGCKEHLIAAERRKKKIFTPKTYIHTSLILRTKMSDPELCFWLHRVLFGVRHFGAKSTLWYPFVNRGTQTLFSTRIWPPHARRLGPLIVGTPGSAD